MTDHRIRPTLVLLPGMDGTGELFKPLVAALGSQYQTRLVRYPNASVGYAALTAVARRWLPTQSPYVMLGESFSGPIAISLAATRPPGLAGLILCGTFARYPRPWLLWMLHSLLRVLPETTPPLGLLSHLLLGTHTTKHLRSMLAQAISQLSPRTLQARLRAASCVDVRSKLQEVQVPLLYLLAEQDRVIPQSALQTILHIRPEMRVVAMSAPHMLLQAAPRTAANAIIAFLREVRKARLVSMGEEA